MTPRLLASAALLLALASCSTIAAHNSALEHARTQYHAARSQAPQGELANDELARAAETLKVAEHTWASGANANAVDHLAYMAVRRIALARELSERYQSDRMLDGYSRIHAQSAGYMFTSGPTVGTTEKNQFVSQERSTR